MFSKGEIDVKETSILKEYPELLDILLKDMTTGKNLKWCTDNYAWRGKGYEENSEITVELITNANGEVIKPRIAKTKEEQQKRIRDKAEVFTPAWICNKQNNLIDEAWFGRKDVFNVEYFNKTWKATEGKIEFPENGDKGNRTWYAYVKENRLEITCGEAPYLTSRYDMVTGEYIVTSERIGLLDRKLRIVGEHTITEGNWCRVAILALKSVYGYEWQGDNVFLARENILLTMNDFYFSKFGKDLDKKQLMTFAKVIAWNIWQMDGLKMVVPNTCHDEVEISLFDKVKRSADKQKKPCYGCSHNDFMKHNGVYCLVRDWQVKGENKRNGNGMGRAIRFVDLLKKEDDSND